MKDGPLRPSCRVYCVLWSTCFLVCLACLRVLSRLLTGFRNYRLIVQVFTRRTSHDGPSAGARSREFVRLCTLVLAELRALDLASGLDRQVQAVVPRVSELERRTSKSP